MDILASSRHVRVEVAGLTVAESTSPRLLFETGYKGEAEWWSVRAGGETYQDLAWSYRTPLPESQKIAGLIAFYDDKVDVYVDGVRQPRPVTKFS